MNDEERHEHCLDPTWAPEEFTMTCALVVLGGNFPVKF